MATYLPVNSASENGICILGSESYPADGDKLEINFQSEYYIAVMQLEKHSFLVAGVYSDDQNYQLARFGKTCPPINETSKFTRFFKMYLSENPASMKREGLLLNGSFRYSAHTISKEMYQRLVEFMPEFKYKKEAGCYYLNGSEQSYQYKTFHPIESCNAQSSLGFEEQEIIEEAKTLTNSNSCRTTASRIVEMVTNGNVKISRNHRIPLPCYDSFARGKPEQFLYVMPEPASLFLTADSFVLQAIYQRMDVLRTRTGGVDKFKALKKLYADIAKVPAEDQQQILSVLTQFKKEQKEVLTRRRNQFDWVHRSTNTAILIDYLLATMRLKRAM
ncbi:hypothetical protein D5R81_05100 [Parashewanella spongiae]|uniref:Uncharacterized protein n=1 Tax=Parashewanella spongiae TaxID=342950 RepID=A0A3A6U398_9GAMM|nr:hypothetical protein [Parashewanella spongiae]MCL1076692.1 hypothetical protein [Parashewanella spongiae]RJY18500.1 hypothetical protein D5R81_05100 [Parashewanella spongiae]